MRLHSRPGQDPNLLALSPELPTPQKPVLSRIIRTPIERLRVHFVNAGCCMRTNCLYPACASGVATAFALTLLCGCARLLRLASNVPSSTPHPTSMTALLPGCTWLARTYSSVPAGGTITGVCSFIILLQDLTDSLQPILGSCVGLSFMGPAGTPTHSGENPYPWFYLQWFPRPLRSFLVRVLSCSVHRCLTHYI